MKAIGTSLPASRGQVARQEQKLPASLAPGRLTRFRQAERCREGRVIGFPFPMTADEARHGRPRTRVILPWIRIYRNDPARISRLGGALRKARRVRGPIGLAPLIRRTYNLLPPRREAGNCAKRVQCEKVADLRIDGSPGWRQLPAAAAPGGCALLSRQRDADAVESESPAYVEPGWPPPGRLTSPSGWGIKKEGV